MDVYLNRRQAGIRLAEHLAALAGRNDVVVLALPRGGVPVGFEVARALEAPLDIFVVRKLGVPGHEELAMGAVASGGVRVLNDAVLASLEISPEAVDHVTVLEQAELARRETAYRAGRPPLSIAGKVVVLVDDGLATGSTMQAAVHAARKLQPKAQDEAGLAGARQGHLAGLFEQAGLQDVEVAEHTSAVEYESFEDWWRPYTFGVGPAGAYAASLSEADREALRDQCERDLPDAPFTIGATAWAVRGTVSPPPAASLGR